MSTPVRVRDVFLLSRIVGVVGAVAVLGRVLSLGRLTRLLERSPRLAEGQAGTTHNAERLLRLTQGVLRRTHRRDFCYPRAFVLFHVLSGWGWPVTLQFGVRKNEGTLEGHAWLDVAGRPFAETEDPRMRYQIVHSHSAVSQEARV